MSRSSASVRANASRPLSDTSGAASGLSARPYSRSSSSGASAPKPTSARAGLPSAARGHEQRQAAVQALQITRLEEGRDHLLIVRTLDVRGLACPLPLIRARRELGPLAPGDTLVVLATDPEAPIDLAAFAADEGHAFAREEGDGEWRITLTKGAAGR